MDTTHGDNLPIHAHDDSSLARRMVFESAKELVDPIVEQHGLKEYGIGPSNILMPAQARMTVVDQHIEHVIRVADWLLDES